MTENLFDPHDSFKDNIFSLSQGNPGAANVLSHILDVDPAEAALVMEGLDKMNIYGPRIWIGYKDYCDEDARSFIDAVLEQDREMVELINEMRSDDGDPAKLADSELHD